MDLLKSPFIKLLGIQVVNCDLWEGGRGLYPNAYHLIMDISLILVACAHAEAMVSDVVSHSPGVGWTRTFCGSRKAWNSVVGCTVVSQPFPSLGESLLGCVLC